MACCARASAVEANYARGMGIAPSRATSPSASCPRPGPAARARAKRKTQPAREDSSAPSRPLKQVIEDWCTAGGKVKFVRAPVLTSSRSGGGEGAASIQSHQRGRPARDMTSSWSSPCVPFQRRGARGRPRADSTDYLVNRQPFPESRSRHSAHR